MNAQAITATIAHEVRQPLAPSRQTPVQQCDGLDEYHPITTKHWRP
jgi:hypothetical protein